jgi:hypothetical protein
MSVGIVTARLKVSIPPPLHRLHSFQLTASHVYLSSPAASLINRGEDFTLPFFLYLSRSLSSNTFILIEMLCFWTLPITLFVFKTQSGTERGFCLLQLFYYL